MRRLLRKIVVSKRTGDTYASTEESTLGSN